MRKKSVVKGLKTFSAILLLIIYLIANTQVETLHELLHTHAQDDVVVHTTEKEKDPCHRTLYHREKNNGCEHDSHFVKVQKCSLWHVLVHSDQIALQDSSIELFKHSFAIPDEFVSVQLTGIENNLPSRAPPIM